MAYQGYGAPPPGGFGGVSEEGDHCSLEIPRDIKKCLVKSIMRNIKES